MKTTIRMIGFFFLMLLAVSCSKDEGFLPGGDELSDVLKGAKAIETPLDFAGWSNYMATVPKTSSIIDIGGPPGGCLATLHGEGPWYDLDLTEIYFPGVERHVLIPLKITPGGVVKGYWPETWYDFGNPPESGNPDSDVVTTISGHVGCDLHGPGINKGTIICNGTFDGTDLKFVFRFNGLDNGIESTYGPESPWNLIEGPAKFEFSFDLSLLE